MKLTNLLPLITLIDAHSWLDCIGNADMAYNGPDQYFSDDFYKHCTGFPRGYPGRMNRNINTIYTVLIQDRGAPNGQANVCGRADQPERTINYNNQFPMAQVKPGQKIRLWYELDNHYTTTPTYIYLWGYGQPGKQLSLYNEQTDATQLGKFVFATPENCMDTHNANSLCWIYWDVPSTWTQGTYSLVWNWRWDKNPSGEEYNTCFDINVTSDGGTPTTNNTSQYPSQSKSSEPINIVEPTPVVDKVVELLPQPDNKLVTKPRPKCHRKNQQ